MNELIQVVVQKTGLPQDKAQLAVETVLSFLKGKLPAVGNQLDAFLIVGEEASPAVGIAEKAKSAVAGLGGLLGKKD